MPPEIGTNDRHLLCHVCIPLRKWKLARYAKLAEPQKVKASQPSLLLLIPTRHFYLITLVEHLLSPWKQTQYTMLVFAITDLSDLVQ